MTNEKTINGKELADPIIRDIAEQLQKKEKERPALAVILVGDDPASKIYIEKKQAACHLVGMQSHKFELPESTPESELVALIKKLNGDASIHGILVQLPLPKHINPMLVTETIDPLKDVDGFHPLNQGKALIGDSTALYPCTPLGVMKIIEHKNLLQGKKHALIIGRSTIVGKPMAAMLMQKNHPDDPIITIAHRGTQDLPALTKQADLIITAVGIPHLITNEMVQEGAALIDIGINRIQDPKRKGKTTIVGDVDFHGVYDKCSWITPVPGGVGPLTIAMLLENTLKAYTLQR